MINLTDLDLNKPSETGFEFEYVSDVFPNPTGIFITVLGSEADVVKKWVRKNLNQIRKHESMQMKRGKEVEYRPVEDDEQFNIASSAIRMIGWRGIAQEFSPENAILLCTQNREIRAQALSHSEDLGNFIKRK